MNRKFSGIAGAMLKRIAAAVQQTLSRITSHPATLTITSSPAFPSASSSASSPALSPASPAFPATPGSAEARP